MTVASAQSYNLRFNPQSTNGQTYVCLDQNDRPVLYADFTMSNGLYFYTNAHYYGPESTQPVSALSRYFGYADGVGNFSFDILTKLVGQAEYVDLTFGFGGYSVPGRFDHAVGYFLDYVDVPSIWIRIGGDETNSGTGHGSTLYNRYMNVASAVRLYNASVSYRKANPRVSHLCANDMALYFGGVFQLFTMIMMGPDSRKHDVFFGEDGHHLVVLVPRPNGSREIVRLPLSNETIPTVSQTIRPTDGGRLLYQYTVFNLPRAKDAIGTWTLTIPADPLPQNQIRSPQGATSWGGAAATAATAKQELLDGFLKANEPGRSLLWFHHDSSAVILPGENLTGFGVDEKKWWMASLLVLGPMFDKDADKSKIRSNYLAGLAALIKFGRIERESLFIRDLIKFLREGELQPLYAPAIVTPPKSELETAIAIAIGKALSIEIKH